MAENTLKLPETMEDAGFVIHALYMSLHFTLRRLARDHGNEPGEWLDDLEANILDEVKSAVYDGPHAMEASGKKLGLKYVELALSILKREALGGHLDP